jgi:UDP-glucuronate 4-epimerase
MSKTVLVSGAAGFIGSHVAQALLLRGDSVIGVDNLNDYYPVEFKNANIDILSKYPKFKFEKLDISDFSALEKVFSGITHVAHLAARAGVRPSILDPFIYEQANVKGTLNLLSLAAKNKITNFVLSSSSSVYGNSTQVPFKEDDSATDLPISPYAATKKSTEVLAYTFHHLYDLNVNVIRPFTVYGPRGRPDMAPWLFLKSAFSGQAIRKFGDGSTRRDYTFIADFVEGFIAAIDRPLGYEIFNLGNSQTVSLNEAIEVIEKVSGKKLNIIQEGKQPGDVDITFADISKAKDKLGYNPQTSFYDGMRIFADWFSMNAERGRGGGN